MTRPEPLSNLRSAIDWWGRLVKSWAAENELQRLGSGEVARMAHDIGLNVTEFERLAAAPQGRGLLLERRLESLGFTSEDVRMIAPLLVRDLERTCGCCDAMERCASDFDRAAQPADWQSYCPNAATLQSLNKS